MKKKERAGALERADTVTSVLKIGAACLFCRQSCRSRERIGAASVSPITIDLVATCDDFRYLWQNRTLTHSNLNYTAPHSTPQALSTLSPLKPRKTETRRVWL